MRIRIVFFLLGSFFSTLVFSQPALDEEVRAQVRWLSQDFFWIDSIACVFEVEKAEVLAVAAPEMVRFSLISNLLETSALEVAYVQKGPATADFSIGRFQMKPSFVEKIDSLLMADYACEPWAKPFFYEETGKQQRKERLDRLKQFRWQVGYAMVFYRLLSDRFHEEGFCSPPERVKFFAAAYNYGFLATVKEINIWAEVPAFPHGRKFGEGQRPYAQWAVAFYNEFRQQGW